MLAVAPVPSRRRPATVPRSCASACRAASSSPKARSAWARSRSPAGVRKARLPTRSTRARPATRSRWPTRRLTAGWLRCRRSAAREKEPRAATAWSVRRWARLRSTNLPTVLLMICIATIHWAHEGPRATLSREIPTMDDVSIRGATPDDAASICAIYNQGIEDRLATLETEQRTPDERRTWLGARGPRHPVFVAEANGIVVGWASLNVFNLRPAYDY